MHIYINFIARLLARRLVWYARAINQYKHVFIKDKHCCEVHVALAGNMNRRMHRIILHSASVGVYCKRYLQVEVRMADMHASYIASLTGLMLHDIYAAHYSWRVQIVVC
jgi:hypothetical protein